MAKMNITIMMDDTQVAYWDALAAQDDRARAYGISKVLDAYRAAHPVKGVKAAKPSAPSAVKPAATRPAKKVPAKRTAARTPSKPRTPAAVKDGGNKGATGVQG